MDVVHRLNDIDFVWDPRKAATNLQKHGVTLRAACEVFFDPFLRFLRSVVVEGEEREVVVGLTRRMEAAGGGLHAPRRLHPPHLGSPRRPSGEKPL